jgi:regulator of sigma E protease
MTPPTADAAAPQSVGGWLRQNGVQLAVTVAVIIAICRFLHPLDVLLAGAGLSLIIFLHELGHFVAAKLCDVHVKTFSIGFGPALPFCSFKYGETTYKLAMIPLGGYVAMVGEGDTEGDTVEPEDEDPAAAETDPRSFKNKSVGQRMLIISAGVIMNILLGAVCFVIIYLHGVEEKPAVIAHIEPGSAAWRAGLHLGTEIEQINSRQHPWFDDLRPAISSTRKGETVQLVVDYKGARETLSIEPLRQEGALYPQVGILPPDKLMLLNIRRGSIPPYRVGSPASEADFQPGDRIVAMTDPANPTQVTPIIPDWNGLPGEYFDYHRRLIALAGKPITFRVVRKANGSEQSLTVAPAYRQSVGLRMRMGAVAALRHDSPAEQVGVQAARPDAKVPGDRIVEVAVPEPDGSWTRYVADKATRAGAKETVRPLDPLRLPWQLRDWANRQATNRLVKVKVLRQGEHTDQPTTLEMTWDDSYRQQLPRVNSPSTPIPLDGLGLAYHVESVVDDVVPNSPAAAAGIQPGDRIVQVRFKAIDYEGKEKTGDWEEVQTHQWAYVDATFQMQAPHVFEARVKRGDETKEVSLAGVADESWPVPERGLILMPETRTQKADNILEALSMGVDRTSRSIKMIYQNLYALVFGRISVKVMSGPITLARAS